MRSKSTILTALLIVVQLCTGLWAQQGPELETKVPSTKAIMAAQTGQAKYTGEFYRVDGQKVYLLRSLEKVAVQNSPQSFSLMNGLEQTEPQYGEFVVDHETIVPGMTILRTSNLVSLDALTESIQQFERISGVTKAVPIYIHEESGLELIPTEEFIVKLAEGINLAELETINETMGVNLVRQVRGTIDQFILTLPSSAPEDILLTCEVYWQNPAIEWAEPDFLSQVVKQRVVPNDPLYDDQWHLRKIGVHEAWDITTGSDQIIIAVIDDGMDIHHEDLCQNLPSNECETPGNDFDDDGNGWTDDYNGWDFFDDDEDPSPDDPIDNHGTAAAGVAAAKGNNNKGVAGCAFNCKLMPLKVAKGDSYIPYRVAEAIYYAAGRTVNHNRWRGADVISISLGLTPSNVINEALRYASTQGRGGKGCPIFCSSGNYASGYLSAGIGSITGAFPGRWSWVVSYKKDGSTNVGDDTVWMAEFKNADGTTHRFNSMSTPQGWHMRPFVGYPGWLTEDDPSHAYGTSRYQVRPERIGCGQEAYIMAPEFYVSGNTIPGITFKLRRSCNVENTVNLYLWNHDNGNLYGPQKAYDGMYEDVDASIAYPANNVNTIAVGACTNFDYRSDYSCYGPGLDFVVPSNGGTAAITTTDRTGDTGYVIGNYTSGYGGTSSSAPLAAGVAALMLSENPNLTFSEVRRIMQDTCDQIGRVSYPNGVNTYYGHGRLDAKAALEQAQSSEDNFVNIDDFESYNDTNHLIFDIWIDGFGNPQNGSTVGYPAPDFDTGEHYMETEIVHSGTQSMPFIYDNRAGFSEATRTLNSLRNWTENGFDILTLFYNGNSNNTAEPMYIALNGKAITNDIANAALATDWTQWNIPFQTFANRGVNLSEVNTISIGFGSKANPHAGGVGLVFFDDIRLYGHL